MEANRPTRVGFCGSWIPRKGLHVMRSDLPSALECHPSWTFSVLGSQERDVAAEFPREVRPQIEVIPFLEREALIEWYHSLAIFALLSIYESFGMVTAETMACGAAAVTTNVGLGFGLSTEKKPISYQKQGLHACAKRCRRWRPIRKNGVFSPEPDTSVSRI
jgi:glycosyltransferase involved in cell wall biosynthesis